jgi:hypothetical protein
MASVHPGKGEKSISEVAAYTGQILSTHMMIMNKIGGYSWLNSGPKSQKR